MGKKNKSSQSKLNQQVGSQHKNAEQIKNTQLQKSNNNPVAQKDNKTQNQPQIKRSNNQSNKTKQIKKEQQTPKSSSHENKNSKKTQAVNQQPQIKGKPWTDLQYQLRNQIVESLKKCNFNTMLPVQQASIPLLLKNYDLAVQAQTGSGKTLSFLIPLLQKYLGVNLVGSQKKTQQNEGEQTKEFRPSIRYLVVSPTRQLCQQTFNVLTKLLKNLPSNQRSQQYLKYCHCATGGSDMTSDIQKLKEQTVVFVGTVGRIRELSQHMDQNWLKKVQYLFIDQADRVLKQKGIEQLIRSVQKIRRTAMFSATLQTLNQKNYQFYGMRNLAKISLKQTNTNNTQNQSSLNSNANDDKKYIIPKSLTNTYIKLPSRIQKMQFLTNFLKNHIETHKIIVFFNTCASVDFYTKLLNGYFNLREQEQQIVGLHGKLKTNRRQKLIKQFLKRQYGCLFATDVVSRGIDFDHIHFIVQVDPPEDPDNYVHRIGRTARINRPGTAILLIEDHQEAFINYLAEKSVGVQQIEDVKRYYSQNEIEQKIESIAQKMDQVMRTDRDYVQKSKKAFVSYIRSYKEHDLRYIFEFKNLDIGKTAHSFFMYRIPRIKQILGKSISSFTQSTLDIETIPWLDKNQELQYMRKKQKREQELLEKKKQQRKLMKNADAKNNKSKRKRIKAKLQSRYLDNLNKEHREFLKQKAGSSKVSKHQENDSDDDFDFEQEDTQQIEQRFAGDDEKVQKKKSKKLK